MPFADKITRALTCMELGERCRAASEAHDVASRALDAAIKRVKGATAAEWKAEHDTRVDLRLARSAYVLKSQEYAAMSSLLWRVLTRS